MSDNSALPHVATVSCSGPDDMNDPLDIADLAAGVPVIEIGVQLSEKNEGTPNYPSRGWISRFTRRLGEHAAEGLSPAAALHVNGGWCRAFCSGETPDLLGSLILQETDAGPLFRRVQLNFHATEDRIDAERLSESIHYLASREIRTILQVNPPNREVIAALIRADVPFDVLFDSSGGIGVRSESFHMAIPGRFNAWAGGLGPETAAVDIGLIAQAAAGQESFGIDAQRRIRSPGAGPQGVFDVRLASAFAAAAISWNTQAANGFTSSKDLRPGA